VLSHERVNMAYPYLPGMDQARDPIAGAEALRGRAAKANVGES
jgi:hypothetical protein